MYFCFPKQLLIVYRSTKLQNMWQLIATECVHMHSQRLHAQSRAYKKKRLPTLQKLPRTMEARSIHTQECSMMCYNTTGKRKLTFLYKPKFNGRLLNVVCTSCVSHYKAKTVNLPEFACRVSG